MRSGIVICGTSRKQISALRIIKQGGADGTPGEVRCGGSAVVTGIYREKGVCNGKPYVRRGRFTDTWVAQGGTWVCAASQSTLIGN